MLLNPFICICVHTWEDAFQRPYHLYSCEAPVPLNHVSILASVVSGCSLKLGVCDIPRFGSWVGSFTAVVTNKIKQPGLSKAGLELTSCEAQCCNHASALASAVSGCSLK